jgi:hypothetical protein
MVSAMASAIDASISKLDMVDRGSGVFLAGFKRLMGKEVRGT